MMQAEVVHQQPQEDPAADAEIEIPVVKEEEVIDTKKEDEDDKFEDDIDVEAGAATSPETSTTTTSPPSRFPFPKAFYDPVTNQLMTDPVVGPDGISHEKKTDDNSDDDAIVYYPNRALQSYIELELEQYEDAGSVRGTLLQWGQSLRTGFQQLAAGEVRTLPDAFYCPISFDLIHEPVIDPDGISYEKAAIYYWLHNNSESPVTRNPLTVDQLRDNKALLEVMEYLTEEDDAEPSILKWKQEHATRTPFVPESISQTTTDNNNNNTNSDTAIAQPRTYAANQEELEAMRRQRKLYSDRLWTAWSFGFLVVVFFFPNFVLLFILFTVAVYVVEKVYCVRRDIQDRRAQMIAHRQEIEAAQAALRGENTTPATTTENPTGNATTTATQP